MQPHLTFTRFYLAAVGIIYLALAVWCSVSPEQTSQKVGFTLNGDSGSSEFLAVYGGLEFGLALILLLPIVRPDATRFSLLSCLMIHGSLCAFRTVSLVKYSNFGEMTAKLAAGEWAILAIGLIALWTIRRTNVGMRQQSTEATTATPT